jgi:hypothetical protein
VSGRSESEPIGEQLIQNMVEYAADWKPVPNRKALYVGGSAGETYLRSVGIAPAAYPGGNLSFEQVLIVGPGGGPKLAKNAAEIAAWLNAGGHLLALGLDEADVNAFLPFKVRMKREEYISASFESSGAGTLLVGIGPADVQRRSRYRRECQSACRLLPTYALAVREQNAG